MFILSVFTILFVSVKAQQSPCPEYFNYLPDSELDTWYGEIHAYFDDDLIDGVFVTLVFDRNSIQIGSTFGQQVLKRSDTEYVLRNLGHELPAKTPLYIKFYVKYDPAFGRPNLQSFRVNGRPVCPSKKAPHIEYVTSKPTNLALSPGQREQGLDEIDAEKQVMQQELGNRVTQDVSDDRCGIVPSTPVGLIANGVESFPGEWPWHSAIFRLEEAKISYICGGTIITKRHVLTAAHCVVNRFTRSVLNPESLTLLFGKHNLRYVSPTDQQRDVSDIFIHPNYLHTSLKDDISLLKLKTDIIYNDLIRPVCLWNQGTGLENLRNQRGTVIGWGLDDSRKPSNILRKVQIPIVSTGECLNSNPEVLASILWGKNYCAGYSNGTSVCNGDSGGGMFFRVPGSPPTWQIRGLVSIGVNNHINISVCDGKDFTIFTDVAQYLDWIKANLRK